MKYWKPWSNHCQLFHNGPRVVRTRNKHEKEHENPAAQTGSWFANTPDKQLASDINHTV